MNLCVMSRNESADSTAIAANTLGLREATFQAPNPPDEKPNTPRLRASGIVRWFASTKLTTSVTRYCSKLPVTGESTHWPQPQRDQPSGMASIIGGTPIRRKTGSRTASRGGCQRTPSVGGVTIAEAVVPYDCNRYAVGYRRSDSS